MIDLDIRSGRNTCARPSCGISGGTQPTTGMDEMTDKAFPAGGVDSGNAAAIGDQPRLDFPSLALPEFRKPKEILRKS